MLHCDKTILKLFNFIFFFLRTPKKLYFGVCPEI